MCPFITLNKISERKLLISFNIFGASIKGKIMFPRASVAAIKGKIMLSIGSGATFK